VVNTKEQKVKIDYFFSSKENGCTPSVVAATAFVAPDHIPACLEPK
jgi:hypothetical protein